ncbi:thymidine kinase [Corynebacterium sp. ZY180755]
MAKLYFRYGTMNSGKSIEILRVAHNYRERGMKPVILKPATDTLGDDHIHSRIGISSPALVVNGSDDLRELIQEQEQCDCVLIDECQFLAPEQVDQLMTLVLRGVPVICYGLRTNFQSRLFPASARLMELAHSIEEIKTICDCGRKAVFNARIGADDQITLEGDSIQIETLDNPRYIAMCGHCFNEKAKLWV